MVDTTFVARSTTILATWLNVINNLVYRGTNPLYVTTTGSANAYTITLPATSLLTALSAGSTFIAKANFTNSGATTLTIQGGATMGPTAVQTGGSALSGSEIVSGATFAVVFDGTAFQLISVSAASGLSAYLLKAGGTMTGDLTMSGASVVETEGAAVIAASSTNIWATDGNTVHVTGNTGISDFASAPQAGAWMKVIFDGTPVLTQSTNLNLNAGGSNVTMAAGDMAFIYADTTAQMDVFIIRKSGEAVTPVLGTAYQAMMVNSGATAAAYTSLITLSTTVACASGASVNVTGVPAGVKRIDIYPNEITTTGTANILLQIGDAGGIETNAYSGAGIINSTTVAANSTGFFLTGTVTAASTIVGRYTLTKVDSATNLWAISGGSFRSDNNTNSAYGVKTLSAELTQFTLSTTDAFDGAGSFTWTYSYS